MEDDNSEQLDWGHDEEDPAAVVQGSLIVDDVEDTVSLGGDDDDEFLAYQSRVPQHTAQRAISPSKTARQPMHDPPKGHSNSPTPHQSEDQPAERKDSTDLPSSSGHMHSFGPLVHALPPKPVVSTVPFVCPSHPSIIEATAMASRVDRDKRNGAVSKASVYDRNESLPPGWEVKYPRNGHGVYYYNVHTQESTWTHPTVSATREKRGERSDRRDDSLDKSLPTRNDETLIPRVGRADGGVMSYDDRHYRPGETGRREERPAPPTQLIDSYVPDSYSPDHRSSRPSPPPARARERNPSPSPRRPLSPAGSYGDRDCVQTSHREPSLVSTQDRIWVARDSAPQERPRERRQHDDPTPPQTERRDPPRDTGRSSTLRPRSPASYIRGSQEPASHLSIKPTLPALEASPPGRKSRFSQVDAPVQPRRRQSQSRDVGMRRTRTDDISHIGLFVDDVPNVRSMSDDRGDDDPPTRPAPDAQRQESRKRAALPPQDAAFRPSARPPLTQRGGGYPVSPASPVPASVPETRHTSRKGLEDMPRGSVRRTPSPPPQPGPPPADRGRGRSRWPKLYAHGPPQMDSHTIHESSRGRAHDVAMDVDDTPLPRSSEPPMRPAPPKRALQDEVPRYPRAMLNVDNDGLSRSLRESREGIDSRHRFPPDDSSRFGPSRDRYSFERHFAEQTSTQKEPVRSAESKQPPPGSNVKLSGTNNIPIGARNRFGANAPPPTMPLSSSHRASTVASGINGEPVAPRRDRVGRDHERLPHFDESSDDRGTQSGLSRREDDHRSPPSKPRPLPPTEFVALPSRPSRAALGISRFGPPIIVKENAECDQLIESVRPQMSVSSESVPSEQIPEGSSRASPPPSRESSMVSFKDATVPPSRPSHLPPRPASPPGGHRYRSRDTTKSHRLVARSPGISDSRDSEVNTEQSARHRSPSPSSPITRKRTMDAYPSELPPVPRDNRDVYSPELSRTNFRDSQTDHPVTRAAALPPPVVQDEGRAPPPMHPERALMLQANGLPPRPPSVIGRVRSGRGSKRVRDERERDRAEPLRGNSSGQFGSVSPAGDRRRYPEDDRLGYGGGGGASLLDRLTLDDGRVNSPSLRDRVQLPTKRDREEMLTGNIPLDMEGEDYDGLKRVRRRGGPKGRKGRL